MNSPSIETTRTYYDEFSCIYEAKRNGHSRYHDLIDKLECSIAEPWVRNQHVLEVGCGTGLLLRHFSRIAHHAVGVDLSPAMLVHARARGLEVYEGNALDLPFADSSFDTAVSFKTLPHVPDLKAALTEMARVVKPGGVLIAEVYNPISLRGLIKKYLPAATVGARSERDVFCRFDDVRSLKSSLPLNCSVESVYGIRSLTLAAYMLEIPIVGQGLESIEQAIIHTRFAKYFAGFVVYVLRKKFDVR